MKSLFKASLLATTLAFTFAAPQVMAAEAKAQSSAFKNAEERNAYALGASLGRYM
ncbi:TPA: FKBP-type peptidyl-prolyl cis-trans isomerase FkpA, partial [Providencia rettgeri]